MTAEITSRHLSCICEL